MEYSPSFFVLNSYPITVLERSGDTNGKVLFPNVKAIVTESRFILYNEAREAVFESEVTAFDGNVVNGYTVDTPVGNFYLFKSGGCGCGSTLKSFNPFGFGVPYEAQLRSK